jgi:hypothetical protein
MNRYYCIDCGKKVSKKGVKRCKECFYIKETTGRLNLPNCIDCDKKLSKYNCKRCYSCEMKKRWKHIPKKTKKEIAKRMSKYIYNRRKIDIIFKLVGNLRIRINLALKGNPKDSTTLKLVGCSVDFLKQHLQSKFTKGMSWSNYGKWHVDHIRPCASFDLSKVKEQRKCFHYTNLQPLWALDNLRKKKKY